MCGHQHLIDLLHAGSINGSLVIGSGQVGVGSFEQSGGHLTIIVNAEAKLDHAEDARGDDNISLE